MELREIWLHGKIFAQEGSIYRKFYCSLSLKRFLCYKLQ